MQARISNQKAILHIESSLGENHLLQPTAEPTEAAEASEAMHFVPGNHVHEYSNSISEYLVLQKV